MSKIDKLLLELANNPKNFQWRKFISLMNGLGFVQMKASGSRERFFNKEHECLILTHRPHPEKTIDTGAAKAILQILIDNGFYHE